MVTDESPLWGLFRPEEVELLVCGSKVRRRRASRCGTVSVEERVPETRRPRGEERVARPGEMWWGVGFVFCVGGVILGEEWLFEWIGWSVKLKFAVGLGG